MACNPEMLKDLKESVDLEPEFKGDLERWMELPKLINGLMSQDRYHNEWAVDLCIHRD